MTIDHISDTARWVAEYRAMETDRRDAIFRDPFARRLAGPDGARIVASMPRGRRMAWAIVVRTAVIDELIMARVREGADMVIDLAAGLDARPWRLELPPTLRWVDVDLPGILDHKVEMLEHTPPRCRYEPVRLDLADVEGRRALFARLGAECKNALILTEGLLVYLEPAQVADLARALHAQVSFRWWITDLGSPTLLKMIERSWGKQLRRGNAPFRFGPEEGTAFFAPFGWRELEYRSTMEEARRLRREMAGGWFWRAVLKLYPKRIRARFRRMSGMVLLGRA